MPIPADAAADLVLVQAALALRGLETLRDRPPAAGDPDKFVDLDADGCVGEVVAISPDRTDCAGPEPSGDGFEQAAEVPGCE